MEFKAFGGLEFTIGDTYTVDDYLKISYDKILATVFNYVGIGNARLRVLNNHSKLKIVYGFGYRAEEDLGGIYTLGSEGVDEKMIRLLESDPLAFDAAYATRILTKSLRKTHPELWAKIKKDRIKDNITEKDFHHQKRNHLEYVSKYLEPIQICWNKEYLIDLAERGIIYGGVNENLVLIKNHLERLSKNFKIPGVKEGYDKNYHRFAFTGAFPLYVSDDKGKKVLIGVLEFDDVKEIIQDPTHLIPEEKFRFAFDMVSKILTPLTLTNLTHGSNNSFLRYVANSFKEVIDAKDHYTMGHSDRVKDLALLIGTEYGFGEKKLFDLELAALLHDVGKVLTPESILRKPTRLTPDEANRVKRHPLDAEIILMAGRNLRGLIPIIQSHHENEDGSGYPMQLSGDRIPLEAKIISIGDAYDAMTSERPYRRAKSREDAIEELKFWKGKQFNSELVDVFLKVI